MQSRMEEFRGFVSRYPKLRDDVRSGKRTWQNIYEEWVLYGEGDQQWQKYAEETIAKQTQTTNNNASKPATNNVSINMDTIKNIYGYIKNINPDSLNRTLNTVQKVIQIAQSFGGKSTPSLPNVNSAYNDWWD